MKEHRQGQSRAGQMQHILSPSAKCWPGKWKPSHVLLYCVPKATTLARKVVDCGNSRLFNTLFILCEKPIVSELMNTNTNTQFHC